MIQLCIINNYGTLFNFILREMDLLYGKILECSVFLYGYLNPKSSDFLLGLHRSLAHQGSAKILGISTPMSFRNGFRDPCVSRSLEHLFA